MTEKIEAVDAAELEALERRARERDATAGGIYTGPTPTEPSLPPSAQDAPPAVQAIFRAPPSIADRPGLDLKVTLDPPLLPAMTPIWKMGVDGKLEPLVEASAVDARLAALEAELTHLRLMVRHTMLLVMVMADRLKVSTGEYDQARAIVDKVDAEAK